MAGTVQSNGSVAEGYANAITAAYSPVGSVQGATKDDYSEYSSSGALSSAIDEEKNVTTQAAQRAVDFVQVLHGIVAEFQTTDASLAATMQPNASLYSSK